MTDTTYNGWTNRETWLVGVHDFFDYEDIMETLKDALDNGLMFFPYAKSLGIKRALTLYLVDWMKEIHDNYIIEIEYTDYHGAYAHDLLSGAAECINWLEIAEHYTEEEEIWDHWKSKIHQVGVRAQSLTEGEDL